MTLRLRETVLKQRIALLSLLLMMQSLAVAQPHFVHRDAVVAGHTLDEYATLWWQWAYSMPNDQSPVRDRVGIHCGVNQQGAVWFLAGGFGASHISRNCSLPEGKFIFFPVINMVIFPRNSRPTGCADMKAAVALNNDRLTSFLVEVDGIQDVNPVLHRHRSPVCFDLFGGIPESYGAPQVYPAAADGYWIMLEPLSPGKHQIRFKARYGSPATSHGLMIQDISYEINVIPGGQ